MSKKNYQILLCEDYYDAVNSVFKTLTACEVGSYNALFEGQARKIHFITKIDGTHTLTFELPRYTFDPTTGEKVSNELVNYLTNKVKIQLTRENEDFFFVVNTREEVEQDGTFYYSYSCSDSYIEELSKSGYGITFTTENGLGTIHELATKVVDGSDWIYDANATGTLYEYTTDVSYNNTQDRYDKVYTPVPVHKIKYIDELERYVYKMDVVTCTGATGEEVYKNIYCYDDTEIIASDTVTNIIYNTEDFVDSVGWTGMTNLLLVDTSCTVTTNDDDVTTSSYYLRLENTAAATNTYGVLNDTAADAGNAFSANQPYLFKYVMATTMPAGCKLASISVYNSSPKTNGQIAPVTTWTVGNGFVSDTYYVLKSSSLISKPYFVFNWTLTNNATILIKSFELFEAKGKNTAEIGSNAEANNLTILSSYTNLQTKTSADLTICVLPSATTTISAYTHKMVNYFTRDNYTTNSTTGEDSQISALEENTVTYLDFGSEVNTNNNFHFTGSSMEAFTELSVTEISVKPETIDNPDTTSIYHYSGDGKYYQYYTITTPDGRTGSKWDYALLGSGANDKTRTLEIEKSNKFNIIQELAELFKVWPVFTITKNSDDVYEKKFYFKESCINENFAGFHRGVNLKNLQRKVESDEIVTKMFVEDQESDLAADGFVTIRTASLNPWGENFLYNFQYYVDQKLLNTKYDTNTLLIDFDKGNLYSEVKALNETIRDCNEQRSSLVVDRNNLHSRVKALSTFISAATEKIASLTADNESAEIGENDKKLNNSTINTYTKTQSKYQKELDDTQAKYDEMTAEIEALDATISANQTTKTSKIHAFENKYAQYIKEGVWSDNSYVDNDTYYVDCLKVLDTSSMPKTTWTIDVIDGSCFDELSDYKFEVGDKTFLVDNEFFGVPKSTTENYKFEVLLSESDESLDNPTENSFKVQNYQTSFEDLFQRIAAATQTVTLNEQTYDKAAYFTADGEIDKDILQNTLLANALILANADKNIYSLDESGLSLQSILNPAKKLRALAEGIFITNSLNEDGSQKWSTGISADGINASAITAGKINTGKIVIYANGQPNFSWNELGITAYGMGLSNNVETVDNSKFVRLDRYGLYFVDGYANDFNFIDDGQGYLKPWFKNSSSSSAYNNILTKAQLSITKYGFRMNISGSGGSIQLGYKTTTAQGVVTPDTSLWGLWIKSGNTDVVSLQSNGTNVIAGWTINGKILYSDGSNRGVGLISSGHDDIAIYAGKVYSDYNNAPFKVYNSGKLYASDAEITGAITATSGHIAGWVVESDILYKSGTNSGTGLVASDSSNGLAIYAGATKNQRGAAPFRVYNDGSLVATKATITGAINADSGYFKGNLYASSYNGHPISDFLADGGYVYAVSANSGTIGGWSIGSNTLYCDAGNDGKITLNSSTATIQGSYMLDDYNAYYKLTCGSTDHSLLGGGVTRSGRLTIGYSWGAGVISTPSILDSVSIYAVYVSSTIPGTTTNKPSIVFDFGDYGKAYLSPV